jgi:ubiquinol-cytochrome c reductase cytochrome b subunit
MCYSPSAQTAWESVYYLQHETTGGWLLRGLHHFMAQAMVVLLTLHLMQVIIDGAYRAPREVNFWLGLILMQIVLGLSLTGYLLPWDQKGYWATRVATNLLSIVPLVGPQLQQLVVGSSDYGHATLTRFFALHAGVLPGLLIFFLVLHIALFRRHGICTKQPHTQPDAMFWPDQVLKDAIACLAVLVVVLLFVVHPVAWVMGQHPALGAELGAPADPSNQYSAARPEWYFLFLFQFLKLFEGQGERGELLGAIVIPGLVMLVLFLMPLVGKWKLGHRFNIAFMLAILIGVALLTGAALTEDYRAKWTNGDSFAKVLSTIEEIGADPEKVADHFNNDAVEIAKYKQELLAYEKYKKSKDYLAAVAEAEVEAERAVVLASSETGIPAGGAIALLRSDPLRQGPRIFARQCASCHTHEAPREAVAEESKASAPNLYRFASREWITGLLDSKRINSAEYFGKTAHAEGTMAGYVTDSLSEWTTVDRENVVIALSAEAALLSQTAADARDAGRIEAGRKLIANTDHCASCHKFHDAGELGSAPDLTGYGSREWLLGMIGNPGAERFYHESNDRMPAFAEHSDDSPQNMLTSRTLDLLVDWLRGQWYEPAVAQHASDESSTGKSTSPGND